MQKEQQTLLVSVNVEEHDDEDALMNKIGQKIDGGWSVIQAIPLSGEEAGPGGASEDFMRYQVTVEREIDGDNVIVGDFGRRDHDDGSDLGGECAGERSFDHRAGPSSARIDDFCGQFVTGSLVAGSRAGSEQHDDSLRRHRPSVRRGQ